MSNADSADELNTAFASLTTEAAAGTLDKGRLVAEGMKKKKECKNEEEVCFGIWTAEMNTKFTAVVKSF